MKPFKHKIPNINTTLIITSALHFHFNSSIVLQLWKIKIKTLKLTGKEFVMFQIKLLPKVLSNQN